MKFFQFILIIVLAATSWYFYHDKETVTPVATATSAPKPSAPKPNSSQKSVDELLSEGVFPEALSRLESIPQNMRSDDWTRQRIKALDGVGRRQEALTSLKSLLKSARSTQKPPLLLLKASLLQDEGDRDSAGDVLYQLFTEYPEAPEIQEAVYRLKDLWKPWLDSRSKDEELIKFNKVLSWLVERAVDETILQECYELLGRINARVFRGSRPIEGLLAFHTVQYGENLSSIAKKYGVAPARIAQINGLRSWNAIRAKQTLRVIKGRIRMVVDKNRFNMDVFIEGHFFKRYGVGIGRGGNTPTAITSVSRSMARNPSYTVPETGELISPDSPKNPIGTRWIGLDIGRGFGIHGTIEPESIGKESSNGCIRLKNEDVEELYDYVMVGDEVQIR